MSNALEARSLSLTKGGVVMIGLGTAICALGSLMASPMYEQVSYMTAALLITFCLITCCIFFGMQELTSVPQRVATVYLVAATSSIACSVIFWLIQSAPSDLRLLGIIAGLLGLFWGVWYMRLASQFKSNSIKQLTIAALAATTTSLGIIIATRTGLSRISSVTMVGCYVTILGIQIYLTSAYLYREYARSGSR